MAWEQRENTGTLFKNEDRTEDKHPHAKGTALIGGVEYWVSAWTKDGKNGKFQSLAFKAKDKQESRRPEKQPSKPVDDDSDLPF